jgi:Holliday junction resolvase
MTTNENTKAWRVERLGWRDAAISERHGAWGFNCPAVDLDFVMLEYNHGKPAALVEYKHINSGEINTNHATYRALVALADGYSPGALPCLIARYDRTNWNFIVTPLNEAARRHYGHCAGEVLSEQRFVRSLHLLRKSTLSQADEDAIAQLNGAREDLQNR